MKSGEAGMQCGDCMSKTEWIMCCLSAPGSSLRTHCLLLLAHGIFSFPRLAAALHMHLVSLGCLCSAFPPPVSSLIFWGRLFWGPKHRAEISSGSLQSALVPSSSRSTDSRFKLGFFASTSGWKYLGETKQLCNNQGCSDTQWSTSQCFLLGSASAAPSVPRREHCFPSLHFYYSVGIFSGATCGEDALLGYHSFSERNTCF